MNNNMTLKTNANGIITLTPDEQSQVYEFYRIHCTMERIMDIIEEETLNLTFFSNDALETVAKRVISLKDDYHVSEDDAIHTIFDDTDYISNYAQ